MSSLNLLWPSRLGTQIIALVALAVAATFALYAILSLELWQGPPTHARHKPQQAVLDLVYRRLVPLRQPDPQLDEIFRAANLIAPSLNLREDDAADVPPRSEWAPTTPKLAELLARDKAVGYSAMTVGDSEPRPIFIADMPNGTTMVADLALPVPPPRGINLLPTTPAAGGEFVLLMIILPVALLWAAGRISSRLREFARAADAFSMEGHHAPLIEKGPAEIRTAIRAFNRMQDRIYNLVTDRTRMLAAVGHDLRTPVTRLRLKAEFIEDGELREGIIHDIARLNVMLEAALSYFRGGRLKENYTDFSIRSLLQTVVDGFADTGHLIEYTDGEDRKITADLQAVERAVENLLDNSIRYARTVKLGLDTSNPAFASITVDDDGPGIPADRRKNVIQPFVTGDDSKDESGRHFGLGLSVTESIAKAHGGRLELLDSTLGGLRASVIVPTKAA